MGAPSALLPTRARSSPARDDSTALLGSALSLSSDRSRKPRGFIFTNDATIAAATVVGVILVAFFISLQLEGSPLNRLFAASGGASAPVQGAAPESTKLGADSVQPEVPASGTPQDGNAGPQVPAAAADGQQDKLGAVQVPAGEANGQQDQPVTVQVPAEEVNGQQDQPVSVQVPDVGADSQKDQHATAPVPSVDAGGQKDQADAAQPQAGDSGSSEEHASHESIYSSLQVLPLASKKDLDDGPDRGTPSKCSDVCFEHGVCNEETGECHCLPAYGGKDCDKPALPACQITPSYYMTCKDVATCECMQDCQKLRLPIAWKCLRGTRPDGTRIENLTELYDGLEYPVRWNAERTEVLPNEYENPVGTTPGPFTSPEECPDLCNGFGACDREHHHCRCSWATNGVGCSETPAGLRVPCFNGCSQKGNCVLGVCQCNRGYFGLDCSLFVDRHNKTKIVPRAPYSWTTAIPPLLPGSVRPLIYVYDLPPYFNTWQGVFGNYLDWVEPTWFTERMHNSIHRTADPEQADYFFLTLFIRTRTENRANIVRLALDYIRARWPFYARKGGRDHILLTNSDWANCEMGGEYGTRNHVMQNMITITNWGLSKNMHLEDKDQCFKPGLDVAMPPEQAETVFQFAPGFATEAKEAEGPREILLYFRGYFALDQQPFGRGGFVWSFGVRQEMYRLYHGRYNDTGILMDDMPQGPYDNVHLRKMLKSIFCLTPSGYGWGMRTTQAVLMGCIPVVIQPDVVQPFEGDGLEWDEFGVKLEKKDMPDIENILRSFTPEQIQKKREAMDRVKLNFVWSTTNYNPLKWQTPEVQAARAEELFRNDTFSGIMRALRIRLEKENSLRPIPGDSSTGGGSSVANPLAGATAPADAGEGGGAELPGPEGQPRLLNAEQPPPAQLETEPAAPSPEGVPPFKCAEACYKNGNCNEATGECFCLQGYTGKDCTDLAMPACHLAKGYFTPCAFRVTCECAMQCQQYLFPTDGLCFRGTTADGSPVTDLAKIFDGPRYPVRYMESSGAMFPPTYEAEVTGLPPSDLQSPEQCPGMCGGHGVCDRNTGRCRCPWAAQSEHCQTTWGFPVPCFNGCSGKGQCQFAECKCDKGYFGIDCSLHVDADGKTRVLERPPYSWASIPWPPPPAGGFRPRVFVYDLPGYFNSWMGLQSIGLDWVEPVLFLERLLNSPHRTADPAEADFFFLPLILRPWAFNKPHLVSRAKEYVRTRWPYFNRSGGKDHFLITNSDWGNCEFADRYGHLSGSLDDLFTLTLFGHAKSMKLIDKHACFRPGVDIVIPPNFLVGSPPVIPVVRVTGQLRRAFGVPGEQEPEEARDILLFFTGYSGEDRPPDEAGYSWSFGVRQQMFKLYRGTFNETGILLESGGPPFWERMRQSVFCLAPSGWGWGMRAPETVLFGCIPVVIQPNVYQAFEGDGLDWNEFGVMLKMEDIPNIEKILHAISDDERDRKRKAGLRVMRRFVWSSTNANPLEWLTPEEQKEQAPELLANDAFAGVMEALRLRLKKSTPK